MYLCGYYIDSTDSNYIENVLLKMKEIIIREARKRIKSQVSREVTCVFDDISLNRIQRPEDISILDMAKGMVMKRIRYAKKTGCATEYNYSVSACVMIYEDKTYIRMDAINNIYVEALQNVEGLIPFHVFENSLALKKDNGGSHAEVWTKIKEKYEHNCMGRYVNFIFSDSELYDGQSFTDLAFESVNERAEKLARHEICARLVGMYSCNDQVPAFKTWEYMDWSFERLENEVWQDAYCEILSELSEILIEIDTDLITKVRCSEETEITENQNN